jgi:NYN domain/OST-HTH/LOTUS domain
MSDTNSTTQDSQRETLISRLSRMLIQGVHLFLTRLQTSQVAVVALLIDGENISPDLTAQMLVEAGKFGGVTIRRVYGNITSPNMQRWKEVMTYYALQGMHQMQTVTGKNAADIALVVDAMDLFYRDHVTRFCLVASDSDYTPLVLRLRSVGCMVIGIGEPKAPLALVEACTVFVSTDQLKQPSSRAKSTKVSTVPVTPTTPLPATKKKSSPPSTLPTKLDAELPALLARAYQQATKGKDSEWVLISQLGVVLRKIDSSFKAKTYGQKDLSSLLKRYEGLFELHKRNDKGGHLEVRLRKQAH